MALNTLYKSTETRELTVPSGAVAGEPVNVGGLVGVLLTSRGNTVVNGEDRGGIGNRDNAATVALNGTFIMPVTGVTSSTLQGAPVYITTARALTLTVGTNVLFGVVDGYPGKQTASACAVKIGGAQNG